MKANQSENQLQKFLEHFKQQHTSLSLRPQGDNTLISKDAVNLCTVTTFGRDYLFGGISESFYDSMVNLYDWREDSVRLKRMKSNLITQ